MRQMPFTPVYELARNELGIDRDEYALCAYVQFWSTDPENRIAGWLDEPKEDIAAWVGVSRPGLYGMIGRMNEKGLLEQNEKGHLRTTTKWLRTISNAKFDIEHRQSVKKLYNDNNDPDGESVKKLYNRRKQNLQTDVKKLDTHPNNKHNNKPKKQAADAVDSPKEKQFGQFMVTDFEAKHKELFPGVGFKFQNKHFSKSGFAGLYKTLSDRVTERTKNPATDPEIQIAWQKFLDAAAKIKWIIDGGHFDPCKLYSQFNTILMTAKAAKTNATNGNGNGVVKPNTGTFYEPPSKPFFNEK